MSEESKQELARIKVAVRIRPLLEPEKAQGHSCTALVQDSSEALSIKTQGERESRKVFKFD